MKKAIVIILLLATILSVGCSKYTFSMWEESPTLEDAPYLLTIGEHSDPYGYYIKSYNIDNGVITALAAEDDGSYSEVVYGLGHWHSITIRR